MYMLYVCLCVFYNAHVYMYEGNKLNVYVKSKNIVCLSYDIYVCGPIWSVAVMQCYTNLYRLL